MKQNDQPQLDNRFDLRSVGVGVNPYLVPVDGLLNVTLISTGFNLSFDRELCRIIVTRISVGFGGKTAWFNTTIWRSLSESGGSGSHISGRKSPNSRRGV